MHLGCRKDTVPHYLAVVGKRLDDPMESANHASPLDGRLAEAVCQSLVFDLEEVEEEAPEG